ncbi:helix-turn-helix domain-containing protein [Streptomyces galilaeus]|uniref:helix-turn-helix domain-containing protein n=1 Tax=Streptomyces galilaeus TaxID=33899 RepID=UPI0038F6E87F
MRFRSTAVAEEFRLTVPTVRRWRRQWREGVSYAGVAAAAPKNASYTGSWNSSLVGAEQSWPALW